MRFYDCEYNSPFLKSCGQEHPLPIQYRANIAAAFKSGYCMVTQSFIQNFYNLEKLELYYNISAVSSSQLKYCESVFNIYIGVLLYTGISVSK